MSILRIAVISDTHGHLPSALLSRLAHADEIWHLGDVTHPSVLTPLAELNRPLTIVEGNCDPIGIWPRSIIHTRHGHRFFLIHIPPRTVPSGVDFILHGHTHVPRDETCGKIRWLNPGCISSPKSAPCAFAWLTLETGCRPTWKIVPLAQLEA